ncbi:chord-domain-containing protein [Martensiomyces pterosporus]|nr:chord-domain-containing protein [Martensiomyces pterosporus]
MPRCTRNGCGQTYDEATNDSMACQYHPGVPKFHEGVKGWTCCKPRVHSFDEFMEINGCTLGPHSDEERHKDDPFKADLTQHDDVLPETPTEPTPKPAAAAGAPAPSKEPFIDEDPEGTVVPVGAKCKRNGCNAVFESEEESHTSEQCQFHPGNAVFHEGTKGWSCCKKRATEFEEFLRIKGCTRGRHLFVGTKGEEKQAKAEKCRRDFYQMANKVIVSVYAKKISREVSSVAFTSSAIRVHLVYGDGKVYDDEITLFAEIDPEASSFELLSTKAEIKLAKRSAADWPVLEGSSD